MYLPGHLGVALLVYAPIGASLLAAGDASLAAMAGVVLVGCAMLPDIDNSVPFLEHRGPTHTLVFAVFVGMCFVLVGPTVTHELGFAGESDLVWVWFLLGVTVVGAHLAADALTPSGVPLFWPIASRRYSVSVCRADNVVGNYGLLVLGIVVVGGTIGIPVELVTG